MSSFHNEASRERLAERWHKFGFCISLVSLIMSLGGVVWHWQAAREHHRVLEEYSKDDAT